MKPPKVIDEQGFLATGDMAMMTPEGFVKLVDRKRHDSGVGL